MVPTTRHEAGDDAPCSVMVHRTFAEDNLLRRVRSEFREMPGMRLTLDQAARLWDVEWHTCCVLLESLVDQRFLHRDEHGRYGRAHSGY